MLAELHKFSSVFATTKENVAVMGRMSNDAQRLVVCAALPDGKSFEAEYSEAALLPVKEACARDLGWDRFFDELASAFNHGRVAAATGGASIECATLAGPGVPASKIGFALDPTTEDVQRGILSALLQYHHVHTHIKEVERQLEETGRQEQEARLQACDLEREEQTLRAGILRSREQDDINRRRLAELQQQLADEEAKARRAGTANSAGEATDGNNGGTTSPTSGAAAGGGGGDDDDDELAVCRVRNPLMDQDHKDYDVELLKLVKARWTDPALESDSIFNSVARPYTTSELAQHTKTFTSPQREAIWRALERIDEWDYDVFSIQTQMSGDDNSTLATQPRGGALLVTAFALLFRHGIMQRFKIDEQIALNWLSVVEAGYHPNPYHNSMHAADVLHITHFILSRGGLAKKCRLTDEDVTAALFAAAIHDYDHPGINNSFHVRTQSYLATLYNDRSVLENRHVSSVFELMKLPKFNLLSAFTDDQRRDIRDTVIEMVLATDMGLHAKYVGQFKRRLQENHDFVKKDDVRLALAMAVKMADISNCGRPERLYLRWSNKIADEFYMQGDRERNHGLPCSPFMDRMQPAMAKGQIAFMNYIVIPLFDCVSELLPDLHFSVDCTENNKAYWGRNDDTPNAVPAA